MSRSIKKGPWVDVKLLKKIQNKSADDKSPIKTWSRDCVITPEMVNYVFGVHNGKDHIEVRVSEEMVGHKLGEFSPTTKFKKHGGRIARDQASEASTTANNKPATTK